MSQQTNLPPAPFTRVQHRIYRLLNQVTLTLTTPISDTDTLTTGSDTKATLKLISVLGGSDTCSGCLHLAQTNHTLLTYVSLIATKRRLYRSPLLCSVYPIYRDFKLVK